MFSVSARGLGLERGGSVSSPPPLAVSVVPAAVWPEHQLGWWLKTAVALVFGSCVLSVCGKPTESEGMGGPSGVSDHRLLRLPRVLEDTAPCRAEHAHPGHPAEACGAHEVRTLCGPTVFALVAPGISQPV